jgi:hypothetical protein
LARSTLTAPFVIVHLVPVPGATADGLVSVLDGPRWCPQRASVGLSGAHPAAVACLSFDADAPNREPYGMPTVSLNTLATVFARRDPVAATMSINAPPPSSSVVCTRACVWEMGTLSDLRLAVWGQQSAARGIHPPVSALTTSLHCGRTECRYAAGPLTLRGSPGSPQKGIQNPPKRLEMG